MFSTKYMCKVYNRWDMNASPVLSSVSFGLIKSPAIHPLVIFGTTYASSPGSIRLRGNKPTSKLQSYCLYKTKYYWTKWKLCYEQICIEWCFLNAHHKSAFLQSHACIILSVDYQFWGSVKQLSFGFSGILMSVFLLLISLSPVWEKKHLSVCLWCGWGTLILCSCLYDGYCDECPL